MNAADEDCGVEWLTSLCNLTVAQGRIPDDWKSSILLPNLQRERRPNGMWVIQNNKATALCNERDRILDHKRSEGK